MRPLLISLTLFGLLGCAKLGPELQPRVRAQDQDWFATLHGVDSDHWTVAVWHPGPWAMGGDPLKTTLMGESLSVSTVSSESRLEIQELTTTETQVGPVALVSTEVTTRGKIYESSTRSSWSVDRTRWQSGQSFQLRVRKGFAPLTPEKAITLEITLGPEPGQAKGFKIRVLDAP